MNKASSVLMSLCLLSSLGVNAVEKNWYTGASFGTSSIDVNDADSLNVNIDDSDTSFKVFGGYQINKYFSAEVAYVNLGGVSLSNTFDDLIPLQDATLTTNVDAQSEVTGFTFSGIAQYPISKDIAVFAKVGALNWNEDVSAAFTYSLTGTDNTDIIDELDETSYESDSGTDVFYGLGLSYQIGDFDLRAEYEVYTSEGSDINVASIGALYRF